MKVTTKHNNPQKENLFYLGNLVHNGDGLVILVTGCLDINGYFSGMVLDKGNTDYSYGRLDCDWHTQLFEQFYGIITLEK